MAVPSIGMLTQMGAGYSPIAPGITPRMTTGMEGVPFLGGDTPMGLMANIALAPYFQRMMGQSGMMPMGVGHDQNMYDVMRNMQFQQMHVQAMQHAAQSDRANYMRTFQGVAAVTGTPFGAQEREMYGNISNFMVAASPILAQTMPEFVDQLGGQRGSAAVMASRFMQSGRYRLDPVTGRMGMDPASAGRMANRMYEDLYSDSNVENMQGVTAGQLGGLFQELQSRGMIRSGFGEGQTRRGSTFNAVTDLATTNLKQLTSAAAGVGVDITKGVGSLSGEDLDKLSSTPEVGDRLRAFDTERVKRSLKAYTSAVSAMRDIFGDAGQPNAPMQELVQGLEALTLGQMHQMDPARMGMMVRQTYSLARNTGMSMDGVMALQQHSAQRAQALGLPQVYALDARYGGMAYGGAYRGMGMAANSGWNQMTSDQLMQADTNLRLQGAASNVANRLNTVMRIADTHGFDADSDAGRLAAAIREGKDEYVDAKGQTRSVAMTDDKVIAMMQGATGKDGRKLNLSENDIREMLTQRTTNLQFGNRYNMGDIVRGRPQREERQSDIVRGVADTLHYRLRERLTAQGMTAEQANDAARKGASGASKRITERMMGLDASVFSDTGRRDEAVAAIMKEELTAAGLGDAVKGEGAEDFLKGSASVAYGRGEENLKRFGTSMQNVRALYDPKILEQAGHLRWQAAHDADIRERLSSLGRHTLLSRVVDAVQGADPNDPEALTKAAMSALGGVDKRELAAGMQEQLSVIAKKKREMDDLMTEITNTTDEKKRADLTGRLDKHRSEYGGAIDSLKKMGERLGLNDPQLTGEDLQRATNSIDRVTATSDPNMDVTNEQRREGFDKYWEGNEGATFKQNVGFASRQVDDVIDKLLTSPTLAKQFGSESVTIAETLQKNQQRLRDLADLYTGGDMTRLVGKDFDIDTSTDEGKARYAAISGEMSTLMKTNRDHVNSLLDRGASEYRPFDPAKEAAEMSGKTSGPEYEAALKKVTAAKKLTMEDDLVLQQQRDWDKSLPEETRATLKGYQENEKKIEEMAKRHGVDRATLIGGSEALSAMTERQRKAQEKYTRPADQVLRDVYESLGMGEKLGEDQAAFNRTQTDLVNVIGTVEGRRFASRLIGTQETLKAAAAKGNYFSGEENAAAGMDKMESDYRDLHGTDGKLDAGKTAEFQKKIGIDSATPEGQDRWASFQRSMQWQKQMKLNPMGGAALDESSLLDIFSAGTSGGAGSTSTKAMPITGHLTGSLTIKGDKADLVATAGGSRHFTVSNG